MRIQILILGFKGLMCRPGIISNVTITKNELLHSLAPHNTQEET